MRRESAPRERSGEREGPGGERTRPRTRPERRALRPDPETAEELERERRERERDDIIIKPHDTKVETTNDKRHRRVMFNIFMHGVDFFVRILVTHNAAKKGQKSTHTARAREFTCKQKRGAWVMPTRIPHPACRAARFRRWGAPRSPRCWRVPSTGALTCRCKSRGR